MEYDKMMNYCIYCGGKDLYYDPSNGVIRCSDCDAIVDHLFFE